MYFYSPWLHFRRQIISSTGNSFIFMLHFRSWEHRTDQLSLLQLVTAKHQSDRFIHWQLPDNKPIIASVTTVSTLETLKEHVTQNLMSNCCHLVEENHNHNMYTSCPGFLLLKIHILQWLSCVFKCYINCISHHTSVYITVESFKITKSEKWGTICAHDLH